ncbi:MAG: ATP-binding protein [Firmicutes bacterium]|nr:ATP-binding protein [Bacillota bacterium]
MDKSFLDYQLSIDSLTVFSALKKDPVVHGLRQLFASLAKAGSFARISDTARNAPTEGSTYEAVALYSDVLSELYPHGSDLSAYIRTQVLADDNFYVQSIAAGKLLSDEIQEAARRELNLLQDLGTLSSHEVREAIGYDGYLPVWSTSKLYLISDFMNKLEQIPVTGYGFFADYSFFRIADGEITPVAHPDAQPLDQLFGYERERQLIIRNTEALIEGTGASNMLLYGDAGTGKSSTIKAVAREYADRGLRIIEVKKNQLYQIPDILEELAANPLKFILFIDDLSFSGNDDNFSALKATLEGSVAGCTGNTVIYATSNRRHLVKENFADRTGDELHANDTIQETMSLAARFGLTITFSKPDKDEYLDIVRALAKEYEIDMPESELLRRAEAHAIRRNGRSPRTAKQFIELLKIGL